MSSLNYLELYPGDMFIFDPHVIVGRDDLFHYRRGDFFYLISSTVRDTTLPGIINYMFNTKKGIITLAFYIDCDFSLLFRRI